MYDTNNELDGIGMPTSLDQKRALLERYKKMKMEADAALANNPAPTQEEIQAVDQGQQDLNNRGADYALIQGLSNAANKIGNYQGVAQKSDLSALDKMQEADRRQAHMDALNIDKRQAMFQNLQNKGQQAAQNEIGIQSDVEQQDDLNSPIDAETMRMMQEALSASGSKIKLPPNLTKGQFKANPWMSKLLERAAPVGGNQFSSRPGEEVDLKTGIVYNTFKNPDGTWSRGAPKKMAPDAEINLTTKAKVNQKNALNSQTSATAAAAAKDKSLAAKVGTGMGETTIQNAGLTAKINRIDNLVKETNRLRGNTNLKGWVLGQPLGREFSSVASELDALLGMDNAQQIREITGAAMGVEEAKRYLAFLPARGDTAEKLEGKFKGLKTQMILDLNAGKLKLDTLAGSSPASSPVTSPVEQSGKPAQRKVWTP